MALSSKTKPASEALVNWKINQLRDEMEKRFEEAETKANDRHNKQMEQLVSIAGDFKKFGEEETVIADRQKNHEDRIERLETVVFKAS